MVEAMDEAPTPPPSVVRAPKVTPEATARKVREAERRRYAGATVHALGLLPPATAHADTPVSAALASARAHGGQCVLVVDENVPKGYVDMIDLVMEDTQGRSDAPVSSLQRPFAGTRDAPATPETFRVLTRESELAELASFLEDYPFAMITDADRTYIESIATSADVDKFMAKTGAPTALDPRATEEARKDRSLADMLRMLDQFSPLIPDEVTDFYLERAGFQSDDVRLKRLLALATEKFVADIAADAFQYARIRTNAGPSRARPGQGAGRDRTRTVLTMDDLSAALGEYGIDARRADGFR
ncbi:uncharacterized protein MJAP1_004041 [Malassezia japonica]|uniref:Transcription initiation factor TFIID subunit 10 n=1 Tax=Malassezia japonica TaxID=223818 RepID=A0AAF0F9X6_9BASI|nr:uncharacterized protein MJAP1_004041 [Malassezia japonica]WFD41048.1 hypothetical protein MJAP1_004041 [Malassezia japonica]